MHIDNGFGDAWQLRQADDCFANTTFDDIMSMSKAEMIHLMIYNALAVIAKVCTSSGHDTPFVDLSDVPRMYTVPYLMGLLSRYTLRQRVVNFSASLALEDNLSPVLKRLLPDIILYNLNERDHVTYMLTRSPIVTFGPQVIYMILTDSRQGSLYLCTGAVLTWVLGKDYNSDYFTLQNSDLEFELPIDFDEFGEVDHLSLSYQFKFVGGHLTYRDRILLMRRNSTNSRSSTSVDSYIHHYEQDMGYFGALVKLRKFHILL